MAIIRFAFKGRYSIISTDFFNLAQGNWLINQTREKQFAALLQVEALVNCSTWIKGLLLRELLGNPAKRKTERFCAGFPRLRKQLNPAFSSSQVRPTKRSIFALSEVRQY